jgi:gliding motility-associated-like protein
VNWLWDFGDGNLTYTQNPIHTYDDPGSFYVSLTVTSSYGCTMSDTLNYPIVVYPHPEAEFSPEPPVTSIYQPGIQFHDLSTGALYWDWDLGDNETSILQEPYHEYPDTGTYTVTLVAINSYGCRDTAVHDIRINGETTTFIPNAFTPNGNANNDVFMPYMSGVVEFEMIIFDRWGNLIFKTTKQTEGWNGRVGNTGEPCQQDVYVYKITTKDLKYNGHQYIGHVTLVR